MLLALLTASSTVADEIEGKTAITLLSKPINRRQFIVGKFLGIELGVFVPSMCLLGALFATGVWYKFAYDMRESAGGTTEAGKQWAQVMQVMPGLALGFLEVTILTSYQRGDFDPVADAGEPGCMYPDFLPGTSQPGSG